MRFGRVPKKEKAKILAAMQSMNNKSREQHVVIPELEDETKFISELLRAHKETCNFAPEKVRDTLGRVRSGEVAPLSAPLTVSSVLKLTFSF